MQFLKDGVQTVVATLLVQCMSSAVSYILLYSTVMTSGVSFFLQVIKEMLIRHIAL